eukprot:837331_1
MYTRALLTNDVSLQWSWNCLDEAQQSCDYLLDFVDSGSIYMDLSKATFEYDTNYVFTVDMVVSDVTNPYREAVSDSFSLEIHTKSIENRNALHVKSLVVAVTSIGS